MKKKGKDNCISFTLMVIFFITVFLVFGKGLAYAGEVLEKQMIAGKEYKVEKIEGEPNHYMITWGEEKYKWEPIASTPDYVLKEGPLFYDRWTKPGIQFPWEVSLEDRQKWDGKTIMTRCVYQAIWFSARPYEYEGNYPNIMLDSKGKERFTHTGSIGRGYFQPEALKALPENMRGVIGRKYFELYFAPDDVAGMGILDISYLTDKPEDTWFYSPSVRKVRRFSEGSRQDFLSGTTYRNEDFVTVRPIHHYKLVGTQLYRPPMDYFGYPDCKLKHWTDEKPKRYCGEGAPCWVIEETPYKTPWWFAKQIRLINMKDLTLCLSEAYDSKGRKIRYFEHQSMLFDPVNYPLFSQWQMWVCNDLTTGYMSFGPLGYGSQPGYPDGHFNYNQGFPEDDFSPDLLLKENKKILFWR